MSASYSGRVVDLLERKTMTVDKLEETFDALEVQGVERTLYLMQAAIRLFVQRPDIFGWEGDATGREALRLAKLALAAQAKET